MEEEDEKVLQLQASEVYVLMKKDYRISRNIRASWFFQHLNKCLQYTPQDQLVDTSEELQVASVVPVELLECVPGVKYNLTLLPSSMVSFVAGRYRFVIILDLSPSVSSVDTSSCSVLYEKIHSTLANFLRGLVLPFCLPGSQAVLCPEIHVTVIAYTPIKSFTFNQVFSQGIVVNEANIEAIIASMEVKLAEFETTLATNFSKIVDGSNKQFASSYFDVRCGGVDHPSDPHGDPPGSPLPKETDIINNPEAGIVNMIRYGMLALQLLPENSSAGLVVITDGCLCVPDATLFEFLLTQLRTSTIACTFLRVGETRLSFGHFGHIPHTELMQFIATATFGSYFDTCPDVRGQVPNTLNVYHKAMFLWSFQRGLEGFRFDLGDQHLMAQQSSSPAQLVQRLLSHPIHGKLASVMPNMKKRHSETNLNTSLFSVLSVRLREGYTIREIALTKGESQIEIRLVLPWREYARFQYLISAAWPLDTHKNVTHTEITIEGSYDFLHDMTCTKINARMMSGFRSANVRKFWFALQGLSETDQLLVHLQSFSTNPVHYSLPDSIKEGVPLFYLPLPLSTTPSLSTQLNNKDPVLNQFASFWRPVVNLDIKVWQKWMHTHRIGIVLEHDIPLHKNIHIANSSGRFSMVQCRQAITSLNLFLMEWSSFVLLDNHSYIKLIYDDEEEGKTKTVTSFVLIRISPYKSPCLVLRLAFLGGTPGYQRYAIVKELKQKVAMLRFPQRGPKADKSRRTIVKKCEETVVPRKSPLLREWSEVLCCVLLLKPVESILIRYERMPRDMTRLQDQEKELTYFVGLQAQAKNKTAANLFNSLSRYLLHHRWIYTVQQPGINSINMQGIGRILSTLAKMRSQQGFHYSLTNCGIVNMVLELDMKPDIESNTDSPRKLKQRPSCVVQYIIFPPHLKTTSDGLSDDEGDLEIESPPEDEGELQIITECWIEPQHGLAVNNTREREHWQGLTCHQIPPTVLANLDKGVRQQDGILMVMVFDAQFLQQDSACISSLITQEHLMYLCQNKLIPADLDAIVNVPSPVVTNVTSLSETIDHVTFPFDLLSLLPRSQQAELIYPTFTYDPDANAGDNQRNMKDSNNLLWSLLFEQLHNSSHREVNLSQHQSHLFLKQIKARERSTDTNPFPFQLDHLLSDSFSGQNKADTKSSQSKPSSHPAVPLLKLSQSQSLSQGSLQNIHKTAQGQGSSRQLSWSDNEPKYPEWKCFMKAMNTNALMLTFIPATYDDLILMNKQGKTQDENVTETENDAKVPDTNAQNNKIGEIAQSLESSHHTTHDTCVTVDDSALKNNTECNTQPDNTKVCDESLTSTDQPESSTQSVPNTGDKSEADDNVTGEDKKPSVLPLSMPVYVYDCITHNILDSLINPWDFKLPSDLYQDYTFDNMERTDGGETLIPAKLKRVSFSVDSIKDEDESTYKSNWRSQERRSTEGSNEGGENLWQHCSSVSETYYNCYVKGVFQSLQKDYVVKCQDVDAAINNICEESLPLETNITSFLHASCGHFQQLVNDLRKDNERLSDLNDNTGITMTTMGHHSVRFMDIIDDEGEPPSHGHHIPSVLEIPHGSMTFDLSTLQFDLSCEPTSLRGLHQLTKDKVLDTVHKWFRSVPDSQDFYFYCPETHMSDELSDERETTASDAVIGVSRTDTDLPESDANMAPSESISKTLQDDQQSIMSLIGSDESMEDDDDLNLDDTVDDTSDQSPLFINFTCTVKCGLQHNSVSLKNVAACLSELSTILENLSQVDLGDLKITFDLNCLTLPSDLETASPRKTSYLRMLSSSSTGGLSGSSSEAGDRSFQSEYKHLSDPIGHLPPMQHEAVLKCMEEIEWLLKDEIVSNLRLIPPIKSDALHYVAKHIHTSCNMGKANINVETVPLKFVYGPDQSMAKFTEEFQKMNLQHYQLIKEDDWFFLARKRLLFNYINAMDLTSALVDLSTESAKTMSSYTSPKDKQTSPGYFMGVTEQSGKMAPQSSTTNQKGFDIAGECIGRSSPLTVKTDCQTGRAQIESKRESRRNSRESSLSLEKKAEGISLESLSLLNRRRSKDLVLRMKGSTDSLYGSDRKLSHEDKTGDVNQLSSKPWSPGTVNFNIDIGNAKADEKTKTIFQKQDSFEPIENFYSPAVEKQQEMAFAMTTRSPDVLSNQTGSVPSSQATSAVTSAVQSPVVPDISIQLTRTDGISEPFRTSPERVIHQQELADESFDNENNENEGVLKRCSSFAGFRSEGPCDHIKREAVSISHETSPDKGIQPSPGPLGRYRHCSAPSGQGTPRGRVMLPQTPSCISSRGSFIEDGTSYDGDMSEMDDSATTFSDTGIIPRHMPNFWLIMQINDNAVDILFQQRETGRESKEERLQHRSLVGQVVLNVENTCRKVNQQLLLNNLFETRMCNALLVDAADEDVTWKLDKGPKMKSRQAFNMSSSENDDDDDDDTFEAKYLAAAMDLNPGHFECPCIWRHQFNIHPGLKRGAPGRGSTMSIGVKALRSVLNKFSVNNRTNMFVIREMDTGNVSYLRLRELQCGLGKITVGPEDSIGPDNMLTPDKDPDSVSLCSTGSTLSLSQSGKANYDLVELNVHGITEAGKEIRDNLVQMLQNKLDEATLDKIYEMLRRNPQCQLERHDVQFIQKPGSAPTTCLHYTVSKASAHLAAIMFYLRQNLVQFLHSPRYKTAHSDSHFMDTFDGVQSPIQADQAFMYIPTHTSGKTGIACISVCLVDGQGNQVKLLNCPKPSGTAYVDIESIDDLESFVVTQLYEMKPHSKKPGPTALIQFHIWERGDVDIPILNERLEGALKHTLCDVVMEYYILTAPICEIPKHVAEIYNSAPPTFSAPTSPFCSSMPGEEYRERKMSMVTMRKTSESPHRQTDRRSSLQTQSKLQSLKDALLQSSSLRKVMSPPPDVNKTLDKTPKDSGGNSRVGSPSVGSPGSSELGTILSLYEGGDRGILHGMYANLIEEWFHYCSALDTSSVNKLNFVIHSRFSMDYVLQEVQNIVQRICSSKMGTRVFKIMPCDEEDEDCDDKVANVGVLYNPNRLPLESGRRRSETSLDTTRHLLLTPGEDQTFILVGRNFAQWRSFIRRGGLEEDSGYDHAATQERGKNTSQKFDAHIPTQSEGKSFGMFTESASSFIPRQRFLYLSIKNRQLQVFTYNWTNDMFSSLSRNVNKLVEWNNGRSHLLSSVVIQKSGLYNHYLFGEISFNLEKVTQQSENLDQLIHHPAPPHVTREKEKLTRASSISSVKENYLPFDATFKDLYPKKPLHLSYLENLGDPIKQYGKQAQDIRTCYKKESDKMNNIQKLYIMWIQKTAPNYPISDHTMRTLKQTSRLFHYCATPLMFSTGWRQQVMEKYKVTRQDSVCSTVSNVATPDTKSRSRHGSGTSTGSARTKRTDSTDLKKRPSLPLLKDGEGRDTVYQEESWHLELRSRFITEYIKYLQSIGFNYVQMNNTHDKGKSRRKTGQGNDESHHDVSQDSHEIKATDTHNLQKTVSGGVLLLELTFKHEYFCVKLYTCDHNQLRITVNQQLKLLFVDECEKSKDLMHVHSFAHDFHLRCIQSYISGEHSILKPGYFLSGLLSDFLRVYPYAPSFSRNFIQRDVVSIPEPSCSSEDLYDYMLKHAKIHCMSVQKMLFPQDVINHDPLHTKNHEYALISHESRELKNKDGVTTTVSRSGERYNLGVVIVQEGQGQREGQGQTSDSERAALQLQFYIILTSSQETFPRYTLERNLSKKSLKKFGDEKMSSMKDQIAVTKSSSIQDETTNYLGFSNIHQPPMYQLLQREALVVRSKIEKMAVVSMDKCRRDCLWNKMLMNTYSDDHVTGKRRSDTQDSNRDPLGRLTYEEFCEMLGRVHKVPIHEMDKNLVPFLHMNLTWYQGLANVLKTKYSENEKRCYINPKNTTEQHHIILNPKFLDLFMLLSIDNKAGKTGLYAVFRKPAKEQESICPGGQNLPEQSVQSHMEHFINTCCFHLWSTML